MKEITWGADHFLAITNSNDALPICWREGCGWDRASSWRRPPRSQQAGETSRHCRANTAPATSHSVHSWTSCSNADNRSSATITRRCQLYPKNFVANSWLTFGFCLNGLFPQEYSTLSWVLSAPNENLNINAPDIVNKPAATWTCCPFMVGINVTYK